MKGMLRLRPAVPGLASTSRLHLSPRVAWDEYDNKIFIDKVRFLLPASSPAQGGTAL